MKTEAKHASKCPCCKEIINPGDPVEWARDMGTVCFPCFEYVAKMWWDDLSRQERRVAMIVAHPKSGDVATVFKLGRDEFEKHPAPDKILDAFRKLRNNESWKHDAKPAEETPMPVTKELLKGLAAAVEIATESGDEAALTSARRRAYDEFGIVPDLRAGMSYDDALAALTDAHTKALATKEPEPECICHETTVGKTSCPVHGKPPHHEPEDPADPEKGAIGSKPLDLDKEDDSWLERW